MLGRRFRSALAIAAVALTSTVSGVLLFGHGPVTIGPLQTNMSFTPGTSGGTVIGLGPLGEVRFRSHVGLIRVDVDVLSMAPNNAGKIIATTDFEELPETAGDDLRDGLLRTAGLAAAGGVFVTVLVATLAFRRLRPVAAAAGLSCLLSVGAGMSAYATYDPKAMLEPQYRGLVAAVPSLVGDARDIAGNFEKYRDQLTKLLDNVSELYTTGLSLPSYESDRGTTTILHISDLHLNPEGWDVVKLLVEQFDVEVVVDTGDISDHGSALEDSFLSPIGTLPVPYVYVRGNHDSSRTERIIADFDNATVLNVGDLVTVAGITFAGAGDPRFTPDKQVAVATDSEVEAVAAYLAKSIRGRGVDIGLFHDPYAVSPLDGAVPLVLSGHTHRRASLKMPAGTLLLVTGSTGAGGLRALSGDVAQQLEASLLHVDTATGQLVSWDEITMGGLGLASVQLNRHLPQNITSVSEPDELRRALLRGSGSSYAASGSPRR